jgi:hypothetical protein
MKAPILRGLRILVVEDEPLCAYDMLSMGTEVSAEVGV